MRKLIHRLYLIFIILEIRLRYFFLGFENVNNRLQTLEKDAIGKVMRLFGADIDESAEIESPVFINAKNNYCNLFIGKNVYIGKSCFLDLKGKITIGENTVVSMQSTIISHIDLGKHNELSKLYSVQNHGCNIGANCYLGAKSLILAGITLNEGSFVAAGSVVTKDVPLFTLVGGVPAKIIKTLSII